MIIFIFLLHVAEITVYIYISHPYIHTPDGATARGGPWPPLQYASRPLDTYVYIFM